MCYNFWCLFLLFAYCFIQFLVLCRLFNCLFIFFHFIITSWVYYVNFLLFWPFWSVVHFFISVFHVCHVLFSQSSTFIIFTLFIKVSFATPSACFPLLWMLSLVPELALPTLALELAILMPTECPAIMHLYYNHLNCWLGYILTYFYENRNNSLWDGLQFKNSLCNSCVY